MKMILLVKWIFNVIFWEPNFIDMRLKFYALLTMFRHTNEHRESFRLVYLKSYVYKWKVVEICNICHFVGQIALRFSYAEQNAREHRLRLISSSWLHTTSSFTILYHPKNYHSLVYYESLICPCPCHIHVYSYAEEVSH